jgi:hypothetical protein
MKSLTDLNNHSNTSLDITDSRGSKVIFDRVFPLQPLDQNNDITDTIVYCSPGTNIVDIINYSVANVRYRVRIKTGSSPVLVNSYITWPNIPAGLTLTNTLDEYIISGITTASQWQFIKNFYWVLPSNYNSCPLWFLEVAVVYYDSSIGSDIAIDWYVYDPDNFYVANLESNSTVSCFISNRKQFSCNRSAAFTLDCPGSRVYRFQATISSASTLVCNALDLDLATCYLNFTTALTASAIRQRRFTVSITSLFTSSCTPTYTKAINDITTARTYQGNAGTTIFSTTTPYIEDLNGTASSYEVRLTSANGQFGDANSSTNTLIYTGSKAQVNAWFSSVVFYPTKAYTGTTSYTYTQYKNGTLQLTRTASLTYSGTTATYVSALYSYTLAGTYTRTITYDQQKYATFEVLVVGGGGGGAGGNEFTYGQGGGGGGGGQVVYLTNQTFTSTTIPIVVGAGGGNGYSGLSAGSSSQFGSITAIGGNPGIVFIQAQNPTGTRTGGSSANGNLGGTNTANGYFTIGYGGGGGAGGAGGNGTIVVEPTTGHERGRGGQAGVGVSNSITGQTEYYGTGGAGGQISPGSDPLNTYYFGRLQSPGYYGMGGYGGHSVTFNDTATGGGSGIAGYYGAPGGRGVVYFRMAN